MITKRTITSIFITPTLGIEREKLFLHNIINSYLGDVDKELYYDENVVFLLFKPNSLKDFQTFLDAEYENNKNLIDDYMYEEKYIILVYKLNDKWKKDFDLIKQSKYSKTSKEFQNLFPKKVTIFTKKNKPIEDSLQHMIFSKSPRLANYIENLIESDEITRYNLEVWPEFNEKNEILDITKIIENENN